MSASTTLSTKGQFVIPKAMREELGWKPGARLSVERNARGQMVVDLEKPFPPSTLDEIAGILDYRGPPLTLEDMDRAITEEVKVRLARGRY